MNISAYFPDEFDEEDINLVDDYSAKHVPRREDSDDKTWTELILDGVIRH